MARIHQSIMKAEVVNYLVTNLKGFYLDSTFGAGGHSSAVLAKTAESSLILALDRDEEAIRAGKKRFEKEPRIILRRQKFSLMAEELGSIKRPLDGVLMDLGLSSDQLDDASRGFSFLKDGPLDMRMDRNQAMTAKRFLAEASEKTLRACLTDYGEEPYADRIASLIVKRRKRAKLDTTWDLLDIIEEAVPLPRLRRRRVVARSFQAIRIWINNEIEELKQGLEQAARLLDPGGRLVVIGFHSVEHRLVKDLMRCGNEFGEGSKLGVIKRFLAVKKPSREEVLSNSRARSAILRVMEKVRH